MIFAFVVGIATAAGLRVVGTGVLVVVDVLAFIAGVVLSIVTRKRLG